MREIIVKIYRIHFQEKIRIVFYETLIVFIIHI